MNVTAETTTETTTTASLVAAALEVGVRAERLAAAQTALEAAGPGWDRQLASAAVRRARAALDLAEAALRTVTDRATVEAPAYVAVEPASGRVLRLATTDEVAAYAAQPAATARALRVGDVLVDAWTGYGIHQQDVPLGWH